MAIIYSQCILCTIWSGAETETTPRAFAISERLARGEQQFPDILSFGFEYDLHASREAPRSMSDVPNIEPENSRLIIALRSISMLHDGQGLGPSK